MALCFWFPQFLSPSYFSACVLLGYMRKTHVLVLCYYNKISAIINLEGERVYFSSQLWRFKSMINWPCGFGPMVWKHIMAGMNGTAKLLRKQSQ
jgi:hypothetical protein